MYGCYVCMEFDENYNKKIAEPLNSLEFNVMTECEGHSRSSRALRPEKDDAQCTLVHLQDDVLRKEAHHHKEVEGNDLHSHEHSHEDGVVHSHEHAHDGDHDHDHIEKSHSHEHSHDDGTVHSHEHSHEGAHNHDHEEGSGDHDEDYVDVYAIHKNPKDDHDESEDVGDVDYSMMKVARRNF